MAEAGGITGDQLQQYIERIEKLEEEKQAIQKDQKEVFNEAKANGFDTKVMRQIIKLRKKDQQERQEEETLLETYKRALGMDS